MKLQRASLPLLILVLIAASAIVVFGNLTTKDANGHRVAMFPVKYGLDIKGGIRAVLKADISKLPPGITYDPTLVQHTLENRINASGVAEATVQPKGQDQFIVELPDVRDKQAILDLLGTTAQMSFYYFRDSQPNDSDTAITKNVVFEVPRDSHGEYRFTDNRTHQTFRDGSGVRADFTQLLKSGVDMRPGAVLFTMTGPLTSGMSAAQTQVYFTPDQQTKFGELSRELQNWQDYLASCSPPILVGADIKPNSRAQLDPNAQPIVTQEFTDKGAEEMRDFTSAHTGEYMGIVLDDKVLSIPVIKSTIYDQGEISGGFSTLTEAQNLANLLNAGALPVPLEQVQVESVEASLGKGAVAQSFHAGLLGGALVILCMLFWYRVPGLVATIALAIYTLFITAIFRGGLSYFSVPAVTLTLPGIAGFILSIGMAVDANILIFERMKEELRSGKNLRAAIDSGFLRAFPAIRDSNICTIITCTFLLSMGSPSVRGFALTLIIGVIVSLFSAITVTRTLLYGLVNAGIANNPAYFGYQPASAGSGLPNLNIIGRRNYFYALSLLIILPGLVFYFMGGLKKSIEFTGGSQMEVRYAQKLNQDKVLSALKAAGVRDPLVQMAEGDYVAIVSTPEQTSAKDPNTGENLVHKKLAGALGTQGTLGLPFTEESFDKVAGIISAELTERAQQAVFWASATIVLYLAIVFAIGGFVAGLRLGVSSIIAMLHDVLVLIGVFSFLGFRYGWKIDSLFVTAMLTVIGFSVHDTVVIFDRVRENLKHRIKGEGFEQLVNRSILQTYRRSIRTSGTVLMTLLALLLFGGHTTMNLNVALFIGILSGTYSSIFNAASILVDWENWLAKKRGQSTVGATTVLATAGGPSPASSGGSIRPLSRPPTAMEGGGGGVSMGSPADNGSELGMSRIKAKKKKPVRRF